MRFQSPLIPARLIRRYKRFLADAVLDTGREVTIHCPNPGAMLGLAEPGSLIWLEPNDDPRKKLKFGWRLTQLDGANLAGIDTGVPNKVVGEGLRAGLVPALSDYTDIRAEVPYGLRSRVDFLCRAKGLPDAYVEVKSVTLRRNTPWAEFPDCVTDRGAKHLAELTNMVCAGHRAVMVYLIQRTDCSGLRIAADLDPGYARAFDAARAAGVEMLSYGAEMTLDGVWLDRPHELDPTSRAC